MGSFKNTLYFILALLCFVLIQSWMQQTTVNKPGDIGSPELVTVKKPATIAPPKNVSAIKSPDMTASIDLHGGRVIRTQLAHYYKTIARKENETTLDYGDSFQYYAQSGFVGDEGIDYKVDTKQSSDDKLVLKATDHARVYTKSFEFGEQPFTIKQKTLIENKGVLDQEVIPYATFVSLHSDASNAMDSPKTFSPSGEPRQSSGWFMLPTYAGVSYHTEEQPYVKLPYTQVESKPGGMLLENAGWMAVQQRYFLNAWVPEGLAKRALNTQWLQQDEQGFGHFSVTQLGSSETLKSNQVANFEQVLYSGPELSHVLQKVSKGLDLTIDYGWLWLLSQIIFDVLIHIHDLFANWGVAIILTTALIKMIFYKLSEKGFVASLKMKKIQPRLKEIQDRFKDDPVGRNQAIMALYKNEQVNPVGGCLPLLVQFPFLIALYWVLIESVQLRHASFLWISDLSSYDPYYILPIVMGVGLFLQQKLTPTNLDPAQEQAMLMMPVMMTVLFSRFPAGLALYMLTNALLSAFQQWYLTRKYQ